MPHSVESSPLGDSEGLRSPNHFPEQYLQRNNEEGHLQTPTHVPDDISYGALAAPMYGSRNGDLFHLPNGMFDSFGNVGGFDIYQDTQAVGSFPGYTFNYADDQNASSSFYANGQLQFSSPAFGIDQILGPRYPSPIPGFEDNNSNTRVPTPAQTERFGDEDPLDDFHWLLTQPVPGLAYYESPGSQASPEGFGSLYTQEQDGTVLGLRQQNNFDPAILNNSDPSLTPEQTAPGLSLARQENVFDHPILENLHSPLTPQQDAAAVRTSGASTNKVPNPDTGRFFNNYEEVLLAKNEVAWEAPVNDGSIPETSEQMGAAVAALLDAMRNNDGCNEKADSKPFVNRWSTNATYYKAEDIEMVAWDMVNAMVDIHTHGWKKFIGDSTLRDSVKGSRDWTFEKRLTEVVELLTYSKRTCEDLLKGDKLHSIIGAPHVLQTRTKSNQTSNKRKAERIRVATEIEKQQTPASGQLNDAKKNNKRSREDEEECALTSVTKRKKSKTEKKVKTPRTRTTKTRKT